MLAGVPRASKRNQRSQGILLFNRDSSSLIAEMVEITQTGYDTWTVKWLPKHGTREECNLDLHLKITERGSSYVLEYDYCIRSVSLRFRNHFAGNGKYGY